MGIQYGPVTGGEVSLYVGHLPGRKSGTVAVQRGSVVKVLAYCRSDDDMLELQQALADLLGVRLPEPEVSDACPGDPHCRAGHRCERHQGGKQ